MNETSKIKQLQNLGPKGSGRRKLLKGAAATVAAGTITGAPMIWAQNIKDVTLRQFGTGV